MRKLKNNPSLWAKVEILVRSGLTLERVAQMTEPAVRTIKRYFRSKRSSFKHGCLSQSKKKLILYYTYQGWDFVMIASVLGIPSAKILSFLDTVTMDEVKFCTCSCGITFPVIYGLSNKMCPFCENHRRYHSVQPA